jgi:hypothetical protein
VVVENDVIKFIHSNGTGKEIKNTLKLDKEFAKLFGYYLSEGCASSSDIIFSIHEKEISTLGEEIIDCMNKCFGLNQYKFQKQNNKKCINLVFQSTIVSDFYRTLVAREQKINILTKSCLRQTMNLKRI